MRSDNVNGTERNATVVEVTNTEPNYSVVAQPPKKRPRLNPPDVQYNHRFKYTTDTLLALRDPSLRADVAANIVVAADPIESDDGKMKMDCNVSIEKDEVHNTATGELLIDAKCSSMGMERDDVEEHVEKKFSIKGDVRIGDDMRAETKGSTDGIEHDGVVEQIYAEGSASGIMHVGVEERVEAKGGDVANKQSGAELQSEKKGGVVVGEQGVESQVQPTDVDMKVVEEDDVEKSGAASEGAIADGHAIRSQHMDTENAAKAEDEAAKDEHLLPRTCYSTADILALKHERRLPALNGFVFSRHAQEQLTEVEASVGELLDHNGRLRTSDVLVGLNGTDGEVPTFADMQLPKAVVAGLSAAGYERPSPVQHRGIPMARLGADLIAQAKSGTGKTGVFVCAAAELALTAAPGQICALVLVPGREVARQVATLLLDVLHAARLYLGKSSSRNEVALLVGGTPDARDTPLLQAATVAVGTPARVRALLVKRILKPAAVRLLILDEADRLLDAGAGFGLGAVVSHLPHARQSMAFSATYTPALLARLRALMRTPALVWLGDEPAATGGDVAMARAAVLRGVRQVRVDVKGDEEKRAAVLAVAGGQMRYNACIAFVCKRDAARDVAKRLRKAGVGARHVTAALTNAQRKQALHAFASGKTKVLVATDMLARGVSFNHCDLVLHVDVPDDVATYLHRVGRAGRFGTQGTSIVIVDKKQQADMLAIESHIGKVPRIQVSELARVNPPTEQSGEKTSENEKLSVEAQERPDSPQAQGHRPVTIGNEDAIRMQIVSRDDEDDDAMAEDDGVECSRVGDTRHATRKIEASVGSDDAAWAMSDKMQDGKDISCLEAAGYSAGYAMAKKMIENIARRVDFERE